MKYLSFMMFFCLAGYLLVKSQEKVITERISIFTDGNSYIEKKINLTPINNKFILKDELVPRARYGTLSITDADNSIKSIKTYVDTVNTENFIANTIKELATFEDFIKANIKKHVTLVTDDEIIAGELVELYKNYNKVTHVLIKGDNEYTIVYISDIKSIKFTSKPNVPTGKEIDENNYFQQRGNRDNIRMILLLEFNDSSPKIVTMRYLQKGLLWNPFYIMELNVDKKEAIFQLKAEVINDALFFKNTDLHLYVGEPNFQFAEYLTDLADFKNLMDPNYDKRNSGFGSLSVQNKLAVFNTESYSKKDETEKEFHDFYIPYIRRSIDLCLIIN